MSSDEDANIILWPILCNFQLSFYCNTVEKNYCLDYGHLADTRNDMHNYSLDYRLYDYHVFFAGIFLYCFKNEKQRMWFVFVGNQSCWSFSKGKWTEIFILVAREYQISTHDPFRVLMFFLYTNFLSELLFVSVEFLKFCELHIDFSFLCFFGCYLFF